MLAYWMFGSAVGGLTAIPFLVALVAASLYSVRGDFMNPGFLFLLPWALILWVSTLTISEYSRPVGDVTVRLIGCVAILSLAVSAFFTAFYRKKKREVIARNYSTSSSAVRAAFYVFLFLSAANVAFAGYIPLLRGLSGGSTDYINFGVPGIYGFYNAFCNALAIFCFYFYLHEKKAEYLLYVAAILVAFLLFLSRQNIISVVFECVCIWGLKGRKIGLIRALILFTITAIFFDFVGAQRSGDIKEIARIRDEYSYLPSAVVWIYSYAYFNILNLDNVINNPVVPLYDGSMFNGLLPSVFRPNVKYDITLDVGNFNITSYLREIYADVGFFGGMIFTAIWLGLSSYFYNSARETGRLYHVLCASVLQFCCFFSFFTNFYFYLPVIFQLPVLSILIKLCLSKAGKERFVRTQPQLRPN